MRLGLYFLENTESSSPCHVELNRIESNTLRFIDGD